MDSVDLAMFQQRSARVGRHPYSNTTSQVTVLPHSLQYVEPPRQWRFQ